MLPVYFQAAAKRAEAAKWQQMQQEQHMLRSQQERLQAEIQEWKARYRDEAAYSSELQAAANRLQTELHAAQLESQVLLANLRPHHCLCAECGCVQCSAPL